MELTIYHQTAFREDDQWRVRASRHYYGPNEGRIPVSSGTMRQLELSRQQVQAANGGEGGTWGEYVVPSQTLDLSTVQARAFTPAQHRAMLARIKQTRREGSEGAVRPPPRRGQAAPEGRRRKSKSAG